MDGNTTTLIYYPSRPPSNGLKWETTKQVDVGLDAGFLDGRLNITADYYYKKTEDLLLDVTLPTTSGFTTLLENVGSMKNQGEEIGIDAKVIANKKFTWGSNFNLSFLQNEVLSLGDRDFLYNAPGLARPVGSNAGQYSVGITKVGRPFGAFYALKTDGIFQNDEELAAGPQYPGVKVGWRRYIDKNGDGQTTPDDRYIMGHAQPDFMGGFTNNFAYAGFDLSIFFEWSYGNDIYNASRQTLERPDVNFNTTIEFYNNRWQGEGTSTTYPMPDRGSNNSLYPSDKYIEDGSYLRCKNITLGYTLPHAVLERLHISNLRVYASATNVFTVTNYSGIDPDVNVFGSSDEYAMGFDFSTYPTAKTVLFGLNLGF